MDEIVNPVPQAYVVVEFPNGYEVIRVEWSIFENNVMVACYFPPISQRKELLAFLNGDYQEIDKATWIDEDGKPFTIKKVCNYATTLDNAMRKLELNIMMSDVESDDAINFEKAKKSRHSRCIAGKFQNQPLKSKENIRFSKKAIPGPSKIIDHEEDDLTGEIVNEEVVNLHSQSGDKRRQMIRETDEEEIDSESDSELGELRTQVHEGSPSHSEENAQNQAEDSKTYSLDILIILRNV
ncbi:uncharacterized protein LOC127284364 [Leptopilina boulardi]|uniref:uncharacterized protein LOC127284364 n=1 Tax=Leptopilina boulardi TaxID=63433 RepID=UPI0021F5785F|nr:uncharacterized protein LOC127284364 [Leptopilina boulardi]